MTPTWLVSWPENGRPQFRDCATEAEAERVAEGMRKSGWAKEAVVFRVMVDDEGLSAA